MVGRKTRKMAEEVFHDSNVPTTQKVFTQPPSAPATGADRLRWKGFCEVESEPVCVLLRSMD